MTPLKISDLFIHLLSGKILSPAGEPQAWPTLEAMNVTQLLNANLETSFAAGQGIVLCKALLIDEYSKYWESETCMQLASKELELMERSFGEVKLDRIFEPLSFLFLPGHLQSRGETYVQELTWTRLASTVPLFCVESRTVAHATFTVMLANPDREILAAIQFSVSEGRVVVEDFYVPPENRRQGFASILLKYVTDTYTKGSGPVQFLPYITRRPDVSQASAPLRLKHWDSFEAWTLFTQAHTS